jgi:hypothetical protein
MFAATWKLLLASLICLAQPAMARAQSSALLAPVGEAPPTELPDDVFHAVADRLVVLQMIDGRELAVRILAVQPAQLVVSLSAGGQTWTVPRASVASVRLPSATPVLALLPDCPEPQLPELPRRKRHLAVNHSLAPGFNVDLDAGMFHGFANIGLFVAAVTDLAVVPVSLGLGVNIPILRKMPALRLDIFAHADVIWDQYASTLGYPGYGNFVGIGVGMGIHYTWNNGLTMGFTSPVVGYAFQFGPTQGMANYGIGLGVQNYYWTAAAALPLYYIGYRF